MPLNCWALLLANTIETNEVTHMETYTTHKIASFTMYWVPTIKSNPRLAQLSQYSSSLLTPSHFFTHIHHSKEWRWSISFKKKNGYYPNLNLIFSIFLKVTFAISVPLYPTHLFGPNQDMITLFKIDYILIERKLHYKEGT